MPNTYTELLKTTVGTATASVTLNLTGISGYTDLVMVVQTRMTTAADAITYTLNGDTTGTNYSQTGLGGDGSSAYSYRQNLNTLGSINSTALSTIVINFQNYSNSTTFKTTLARTGSAAQDTRAIVSLWRNTAAITSIALGTYSSTFVAGSTFSLYGIANADQGAAKATGGIITEDSQYWYHTFAATGAFIPKQSLSCDVLMIAGGGGGGTGDTNGTGGGGGAGGYRLLSAQTIPVTACTVTVGAGGAVLTSGSNSSIAGSGLTTISSSGGGRASGLTTAASSGGSGGGGAGNNLPTGGAGNAGAYSPVEGYAGGTTIAFSGSGGGGAAGIGIADTWNGSTGTAGNGGPGVAVNSTWLAVVGIGVNGFIGGGGGGGRDGKRSMTAAIGGIGGGGNGCSAGLSGQPGIANSGGGGGGGGNLNSTEYVAAAGGSGVVIIRYAK